MDRQKKPRQKWYHHELKNLQTDLDNIKVGDGGTGSAKADGLIREWLPELLA